MKRPAAQASFWSARAAPHEPDERPGRREHLHGVRPALYLAVRPLLDIVGPDLEEVLGGEREVGQRVLADVLEQLAGPAVDGGHLLDDAGVHRPHQRRVALAEGRRQRREGAPPVVAAAQPARDVALQVDYAALPRRTGEDLADGAPEPGVGVGHDEAHPGDPAAAQAPQEAPPRVERLDVDVVEPDVAARPVLSGGDRRDDGAPLDPPAIAAAHVGRVEPQVGEALRVLGLPHRDRVGVEAGGHPRHGRRAQPAELKLGGGPLDLAGRKPQLVDLRYRAHHRAVGAGVGPEHLVGEVAALPEPGDPEPYLADDGHEPALPVAVPAHALPGELVDRHLHGGVHALLDQPDGKPPEVDGALVGGRHVREGHRGRLVRYSVHVVISYRLSVVTEDSRRWPHPFPGC